MPWQVFLLFSILGESIGRVVQRYLLKGDKTNPVVYAVWFEFISGCFLLTVALINGLKFPEDPISILPNLLLLPFIYGATAMLTFKALSLIEASVFTILFNARAIVIVFLAVIFLNESFSGIQLLGTALILGSVAAVSLQKASIKLQKGEILTLIAGLVVAVGAINDSIIINKFDPLTFSAYGFFAPILFIWSINLKHTKEIINFPKSKIFPKIFILSACFSTAFSGYNLAYGASGNAAQIAAIFPISSVVTVLLAVFLLKERQHLFLKIGAAIVSFIGVLLIS